MARPTFPRRNESHEITAAEILQRHASASGKPIVLPVPIEMIVEETFRLEILYEIIEEPPGTVILGALSPTHRRIVINSTHERFLAEVHGPERFTVAHELAHWVYDAENPDQLAFDLSTTVEDKFCYHGDSPNLPAVDQIREMNANKLAAAVLLPADLMRAVDINSVMEDLRGTARRWGVSQQSLRIRLQGLGLVDDAR